MFARWRWVMVLFIFSVNGVAEDDFLKSIEAEAARVQEDTRLREGEVVEKHHQGVDEQTHENRRLAFEAMLRAKHKGTYSIYKSLIDKDRAEVFEAWESGKSLREVRKMMIDRKMHR